jgi:tRNA(Met) cytidine acetyltransferase
VTRLHGLPAAPGLTRHRRCIVLRGSPGQTEAAALEQLGRLEPGAVLWIADTPPPRGFVSLAPRQVVSLLGRSFDAVVLDAHDGLDADVLGQSHGLCWGGGGFILRLPPHDAEWSLSGRAPLAAFPYTPQQVGTRFWSRFERVLASAALAEPTILDPPPHDVHGHAEQARVAARLVELWSQTQPSRVALLADRGRGKSSALGLALAALRSTDRGTTPVAVSAAHPDAVTEVFRFAGPDAGLEFVPFAQLVFDASRFDVILIDEAAQLPVPMLRSLVETHAAAHLCFSTTLHGYEGTGRGFSLRFLTGLERAGPLVRLTLGQPIRWDDGDPLERLMFDALLLDAEPARLESLDGELEAARIQQDELARDELGLRELFGLLVHAHYRTTPGDLHRLLDAPNLAVHVLRLRGHIVAATIIAEEGELPDELCAELLDGRRRIRAHALAELLVAHLGKRSAGSLRMRRSVRIATHPQLRRRGLARALVEHVHREHGAELFGTVFGATADLLAFRRSVGYQLVRVSASRGARTGEPSVLMLRPVSQRAHELVAELRAELARDLPRVLELLRADGETLLDPELASALSLDLPKPALLSTSQCRALVESYAFGPRTFESVALALAHFVAADPAQLDKLAPSERALIEGRVIAGRGWRRVTLDAGFASVPAAMRALRRAVRRLLEPMV